MPPILQALIAVALVVLVFAAGWYSRGYHDPSVRHPRHRGGRRLFPAPVDEPEDETGGEDEPIGEALIPPSEVQRLAPGRLRPAPAEERDPNRVDWDVWLGRHAAGVIARDQAQRLEEDR